MSNTTLDTLEGLSRKLTISVPKDEVSTELNLAYKDVQTQVQIQGFRKGKAPLSKVKSMYKDKIEQDVIQKLISKAYQTAIDEHSQNPISYPKIDFKKFEDGQDFSFTAVYEIRPEVTVKKIEGLKVQKEKLVIDENEITKVLENMQTSMAEPVPVLEDRPAQLEDITKIDFDGFVNDAPLDGGQAKDFELELGTNSFIPGFEEGIVGMKIDETKELTLKFPDEYHAADIAGKPVLFKVKLNALLKKSKPELNDEFAQKIGEEFKTIDDLKNRIKTDMEEGEGKRIQDDLKNRVLKSLIQENPVDVPKTLHFEQKQKLIDDLKGKMDQQGMTAEQFEDYKAKWDSDFNETASFMIQSSFLIDALSTQLKIKASQEDIDNKLIDYSKEANIELDQLKEFYNTPDKRAQLAFQITEDRIVKHLIDNAKIEEVPKDKLKDKKED